VPSFGVDWDVPPATKGGSEGFFGESFAKNESLNGVFKGGNLRFQCDLL